jgi:glyoxylase-like metal-dependent hydrolase (beta-lactamase superfamily II)
LRSCGDFSECLSATCSSRAFYDGFVPVPAGDLHGAPSAEIARLLTEAYMPPEGDPRTAVIAFLVEQNDRRILIDTGSGDSLGPDTGYLAANLAAAGIDADDIDHVLLTYLHPDHAGGLISGDGQAAFSHATVHAAKADADHWLDAAGAACATGVQRLVYETAARVLDPYRDTGRFVTFGDADEPIPGVGAVNLAGHSPGHTGYLFGSADETLLLWGDTVHNHACSCAARPSRRPLTATKPRRSPAAAGSSTWWPRIDGGWAAPTCPSPVLAIFAAIPTATHGYRSPSHRSIDTASPHCASVVPAGVACR